jgi:hypothetical protein
VKSSAGLRKMPADRSKRSEPGKLPSSDHEHRGSNAKFEPNAAAGD